MRCTDLRRCKNVICRSKKSVKEAALGTSNRNRRHVQSRLASHALPTRQIRDYDSINPSDDVRLSSSPPSFFLIRRAETHFQVFRGSLSHLHIWSRGGSLTGHLRVQSVFGYLPRVSRLLICDLPRL